MAISPPKWASQCVPTTKGWQDPKTGEILVGGSISNAAITEWHEAHAPKDKPQTLKESPTTEEEFAAEHIESEEELDEIVYTNMTKAELVEFAAEYGIELSSSMTKAEMIEELSEYDLED